MKTTTFSFWHTARCAWPLLACVGMACLAGCSSSENPADTAHTASTPGVTLTQAQLKHVRLVPVQSRVWQKTLQVTGTVDYDHDQATDMLAPISGRVTKVLVAMGDTVKKGQVLARVDSPDFAQAVGDYRQALAKARTDHKLADHAADLLKHQGMSARDAAQVQNDALAAEAARDAAQRKLQTLNVPAATIKAIGEGKTAGHGAGVIRAPIAGTVVARSITPGQHIQAGDTPCFGIADLSRMWVKARLFADDMAAVKPGNAATVLMDSGGKPMSGKVTAVSAMVDSATGAATARVALANPHGVLKKGMYVRVRIDAGHASKGLLVPLAAVLRDDDNRPFVYVVDKNKRFLRRHVGLGDHVGKDVVIVSGLAAGQQVVSAGGIFLRFMQSQ